MTRAGLLLITLVGIDVGLAFWKQREPRLDKFLEDAPQVIVKAGQTPTKHMQQERIAEADIL